MSLVGKDRMPSEMKMIDLHMAEWESCVSIIALLTSEEMSQALQTGEEQLAESLDSMEIASQVWSRKYEWLVARSSDRAIHQPSPRGSPSGARANPSTSYILGEAETVFDTQDDMSTETATSVQVAVERRSQVAVERRSRGREPMGVGEFFCYPMYIYKYK